MALRRTQDILADETAYALSALADDALSEGDDIDVRTLTRDDLTTPRCITFYERLAAEQVVAERDRGRLVAFVRSFLAANPIFLLGRPSEVGLAMWKDLVQTTIVEVVVAVKTRHEVAEANRQEAT